MLAITTLVATPTIPITQINSIVRFAKPVMWSRKKKGFLFFQQQHKVRVREEGQPQNFLTNTKVNTTVFNLIFL